MAHCTQGTADVSPSTAPEVAADARPHATPHRLFLFFTYRSLIESSSMDHINFLGWKEVLDAFGYETLSLSKCIADLALRSPHEVMTALCPFTTKAEWAPLLNKRDTRLERDVGNLCYTEVLPLQGVKDFLIDCAKHAQTVVVLLSPFREVVSRQLLEIAELNSFVDVVHCYSEQEFGILEALERLNAPPPVIPSNLRHRWEAAPSADASSSSPGCDGLVPQEADVVGSPLFLSFDADVQGLQYAKQFGIRSVGVSFNAAGGSSAPASSEAEGREDGSTASVQDEAVLLQAGASMVVRDFTSLKHAYLQYVR